MKRHDMSEEQIKWATIVSHAPNDSASGYASLCLNLDANLKRLRAEVENLTMHGCMTGDCPHEQSVDCALAMFAAVDEFKQRVEES